MLVKLQPGVNKYFSSYANVNQMAENFYDEIAKLNNGEISAEELAEEFRKNMANGDYTTTRQEYENKVENAATYAATLKEQWPDAFDILTGIAGTLGNILMAIIGGKLLDVVGNGLTKGLGKLFGSGESVAGKAGFFSNFANGTTGTVGGAIGNTLFDIGAEMGASGSSTLGAQALGAAGVAGTAALLGGRKCYGS